MDWIDSIYMQTLHDTLRGWCVMKRIRFYVGMDFDSDDKEILDVEDKQNLIEEILTHRYGGFTKFRAMGGWVNTVNGVSRTVHERCTVWEILVEKPEADHRTVAAQVRDAAKQYCVLVTVEDVEAEFI